jgi:hypothetical protein
MAVIFVAGNSLLMRQAQKMQRLRAEDTWELLVEPMGILT